MSMLEMAHRGREALRKKTGKHLTRRIWRPSARDAALPSLPGLCAHLHDWDVPEELLREWQEGANQAELGRCFC